VLVDDQNRAAPVTAKEMGMMLQDHRVLIAVLNGCNTGAALEQDLAQGVAQVLVREGVPVAVATTREVFNHTALRFASEFYRALVDGYAAGPATARRSPEPQAPTSFGINDFDLT
jgi:CHAT domain-containing protein